MIRESVRYWALCEPCPASLIIGHWTGPERWSRREAERDLQRHETEHPPCAQT